MDMASSVMNLGMTDHGISGVFQVYVLTLLVCLAASGISIGDKLNCCDRLFFVSLILWSLQSPASCVRVQQVLVV